ncbi:MAG: hypothetical protein MZU95_09990 [Desulfomicrobium escambiense]|nr:hypothetical protein [Desulfomicrobium escambiense]
MIQASPEELGRDIDNEVRKAGEPPLRHPPAWANQEKASRPTIKKVSPGGMLLPECLRAWRR